LAAETTLFLLRIAFLLLLYVFLVSVLVITWRDLTAVQKAPSGYRQEHVTGWLQVTNPGTTGFATGDVIPLRPVTAIGRDLSNDIVLADSFASAHHALLTYRQSRWWLEDLNSSNGTTVNGTLMKRPIPLDTGDIIGIGQALFKLN